MMNMHAAGNAGTYTSTSADFAFALSTLEPEMSKATNAPLHSKHFVIHVATPGPALSKRG